MLYEDVASGDGRLGQFIDRWTRELPAARAVKNRRQLLAEEILCVAATWTGNTPIHVTSLAAGPAVQRTRAHGARAASHRDLAVDHFSG